MVHESSDITAAAKLYSKLVVGIRSVKFGTFIQLQGEGGRELEWSAPSSSDTGP